MIKNISFQQIPVRDQHRALVFYAGKLGFKRHTDAPWKPGVRWAMLRDSEGDLILLESMKAG
ncbi:hypothetical protein LGT41_0011150 [Abyssibius alkaniclasticus]|uniref:hypothetical protein n=1 Tax=Abyssibius alkaniclasticus TaxID=2881234 RepID=UPI0023632571|nr:hypothetical protein [Abyssibius alkaniclasticus]UPH70350.1 hypothetical protein LGT41_0011150 [Abyssibius alkaniclasticus]|tara:strand:- start:961 stop:1146 length:186 start_codon:yes stop_codon:yes gene_type:complete